MATTSCATIPREETQGLAEEDLAEATEAEAGVDLDEATAEEA
jgi:hypothetical protein